MNSAVRAIANRLKEPSSWAGLAGIFALTGLSIDPSLAQSIALIGSGIAGVVAIVVPENK